MTADVAALRAEVTRICLALPEATTRLSHGADAFQAGGKKMFAYFVDNHHGSGITAVLVKTTGPDEQEMLIESDPALYYRPPYIGGWGWVGVRVDPDGWDGGKPDWEHVAERIRHSYRLTAPRRLAELV